jgi:TAG lipase/steryl ester hydrolase/phospholipase A2/LPA acyltransferase
MELTITRCASCSVPFVFSAASLKAKGRTTGKEVPWDPTPNTGWIDGSVDNDLPMTRLAEMFNVNHFIVSQVNPHVVPFLIKEEEAIGAEALQESAGSGWMQDFASFAKDEALHRLDMLIEMGVLTNVVTKARSVLSQRYSGDITIFPAISYENFPKVLSNPTTDYMEHCLLTGEKATWPKMPRIRNHVAVELALDESINKIRPLVHFSQLQSNRRLEHFASTGGRVSQARRLHRSAPFGSDTALSTPTLKRSSALPRHFTVRNKIRLRPTSDPHLRSRSSKFDVGSFGFSKSFSKVHVTSSTDPDGSSTGEDFSSNDESDTTEFVSSPSPSHSHLQLPFIFPSASESSIATTTFGHQSQFSYNLNMTPAAPSSPEVRYRRLFHPPASTIIQDSSPILQQEIKNPTVSTKDLPFLQQTGTLSQDLQPSNLAPNDSLNEYTIQAFTQPTFTPVLSLRSTRAGANISRQQQKETTEVGKYAEEIRGGIAQSWPLDNSGFRAMGLRKKPSGDSDRAN